MNVDRSFTIPPYRFGKPYKLSPWKSKLSSMVSGVASSSTNKTGSMVPQGVSTAMDARIETGVELFAELRLRVGSAL